MKPTTLSLLLCLAIPCAFGGCGQAPEDDGAPAAATAALPMPADPDSPVTIIAFRVKDEKTEMVHQITTTKGEQWRRMTGAKTSPPQPATAAGEFGNAQSAVSLEDCHDGSTIWLNNGPMFSGRITVCFLYDGNPFSWFDLTKLPLFYLGLPDFLARSWLAAGTNLTLRDDTGATQEVHCESAADHFHYVQDYQGPKIRYVQTPSNRTGRCHF